MTTIHSLRTLTLDLPPSCIEFWPEDDTWAVIGTYHLEKKEEGQDGSTANARQDEADSNVVKVTKPQQRSGSLVLLQVEDEEISVVQTLPTPFAIFDMHFQPSVKPDTALLGAATSTGSFALYRLERSADSPTPTLTHLRTLQIYPFTSLITFFSWHPTDPTLIAVTLATGEVDICRLPPIAAPDAPGGGGGNGTPLLPPAAQEAFETTRVHAHTLEAWFVAFTRAHPPSLLSGGDDSALKYSRLPDLSETLFPLADTVAEHAGAGAALQWSDRRLHDAGVTAILPLPPLDPTDSSSPSSDDEENNTIVLTGSYDEHLRVVHAPEHGRRAVLADAALGGGVWRLSLIRTRREPGDGDATWLVLASCMHAGTRVVAVRRAAGTGAWSIDVRARFEEHASMNYGSGFRFMGGGDGNEDRKKVLVVSTSFYDRLVALWHVEC